MLPVVGYSGLQEEAREEEKEEEQLTQPHVVLLLQPLLETSVLCTAVNFRDGDLVAH